MSQSLPNTDDNYVASLALAWEIVKEARLDKNIDYQNNESRSLGAKQLTNEVIEIAIAISNASPISIK